jgi:hypothetical protein
MTVCIEKVGWNAWKLLYGVVLTVPLSRALGPVFFFLIESHSCSWFLFLLLFFSSSLILLLLSIFLLPPRVSLWVVYYSFGERF